MGLFLSNVWSFFRRAPLVLTSESRSSLKDIETFIFDCDGVLYHNYHPVPGSPDFVKALVSQGRKCFFVTNASGTSRKMLSEKLTTFGFGKIEPSQCISAGSAVADYLKLKFPECKTAYVVGKSGLIEELENAGVKCAGPGDVGGLKKLWDDKFYDQGLETCASVIVGHMDEESRPELVF